MPKICLAPLSSRFLSFSEREDIALLRVQGHGVRDIARQIGRHASTVSRELCRNAATRSGYVDYRATTAQWRAARRGKRPKIAKLVSNEVLRKYVQDRLSGAITTQGGDRIGPNLLWKGRRHGERQDRHWATSWSPQQIPNRLHIGLPDDTLMRISHEAIYQALYIKDRGALNRAMSACLRSGRPLRVPRARVSTRGRKFVTPDVMLAARPPEVEQRLAAGHWEGDLIIGLGGSAIGTLVERVTRFTILLHLPRLSAPGTPREKNGLALAGHGSAAVGKAIAASMKAMPSQLGQSLTWDQGAEMSQHVQLRQVTGLKIYLCEPRSPWQRGTNENTNGLLRQYFPKGTDIARYGADELAAVARTMNNRPRKVLGWKTPAEMLEVHMSSIEPVGVATTG